MKKQLSTSLAFVAGAAIASLLLVKVALAQGAAPPGFQAIELRHTSADEAAGKLHALVPATAGPLEVLVDRQQNRVLVRGPQGVLDLARQTLSALDQPPAVAPPEQPVLRTYRPAGDLDAVARSIEAEVMAAGGRVAMDARTRQLLVLAPPSLHQRFALQLTDGAAGEAPRSARPPAEAFGPSLAPALAPAGGFAPMAPNAVLPNAVSPNAVSPNVAGPAPAPLAVTTNNWTRHTHALRNISWRELEDLLPRGWKQRMTVDPASQGERSMVLAPAAGGQAVQLTIDRRGDRVEIVGPAELAAAAQQVVAGLDRPPAGPQATTVTFSLEGAAAPAGRRAAALLGSQVQPAGVGETATAVVRMPPTAAGPRTGAELAARMFQGAAAQNPAVPPNNGAQPPGGQPVAQQPNGQPLDGQPLNGQPLNGQPANGQPANGQPPVLPPGVAPGINDDGGLLGSVQIEFVPGLDIIILRGHPRDVARVAEMIRQIEELSIVTQPTVEIKMLQNVGSQQMTELVTQVYADILSTREGQVNMTALVKPNAILLVGRADAVETVAGLIDRLDQPVPPATQFAIFHLKHMPVVEAEQIVTNFFTEQQPGGTGQQFRPALGARARVLGDFRSNSLIVYASPRDLAEVRLLLARLDVARSGSTNEMRVFKLRNSLADDLAPVLQEAITGPLTGQDIGASQGVSGGTTRINQLRSRMLTFLTIDNQGGKLLESGILNDVRITADARANALLVTAPSESMGLIAALIAELDALPAPSAAIKVFTIVNGDATRLSQMLQTMFGVTATQGFGAQAGQIALQSATGSGESSLVPMRFGVDERSNSIIASGAEGDLLVVEAILRRLDEEDVRQRRSIVYRLKNAPAQSVADAVNQLLTTERQVLLQQQQQASLISPNEQLEREVIVVPELVSNSLILSATPRFFDLMIKVIDELDRRPPMIRIDVLIAEVVLNDYNELGVEVGLQDALLFDRGIGAQLNGTPGIGFPFVGAPLGNNVAASPNAVGSQGFSSFGLGRSSSAAGFGGLVLSASSESVNVLVRALQDRGRLQVLSRPQITTMDNLPGSILVGQIVSRLQGTTITNAATTQNVNDVNVGLLLDVTPRVTPDGLVVMAINAQKSRLGPVSEGVPVGTGANGELLFSPNIDTIDAETTVAARSGQTVVFSGLLTKDNVTTRRGVPWLCDLPVVGPLFRFDTREERRGELLIILTPYVLETDDDIDWVKQTESERMSWCLADVIELYGDVGLVGRPGPWDKGSTKVIFPALQPTCDDCESPGVVVPSPMLPAPLGPGGAVPMPAEEPQFLAPTPATSRRPNAASRLR